MMNRYKLFKAGIDTNEGIKRFNGKTELYEKYLMKFPEDPHFTLMCEAIENGDVKAAFAASHALKGVAGNLSMNSLYQDIIPLVEELRADSLAKAEELLVPVERDYQAVLEALKV
ncbi:MAG: Hpt domain-containing protein [Eubacteriales bacterium]|nr:Hpt domain-containing protein [Eubacteriales bacterium]